MFLAVSWYVADDNLKISEIKNHLDRKLITSTSSIGLLLPVDKNFPAVQFADKQRFTIRVDDLLLKNYDYISIVCSDSPPDENLAFPYHKSVITRAFNISEEKSNCDAFVITGFSTRLSDNSQLYWFLELGFYVFVLIFVVVFRNGQPLKSRVFIPYLALVAQYGATFSSIQNYYFDLEWRSKYGRLLQTYFYESFLSMIFLLMPLNYLRYVLLINMNKEKENISESGKTKSLYFRFLLAIKFLVTPSVSMFIIGGFWCFSTFIDSMIFFAFSPQLRCSTGKSYGIYSIHLFYNIVCGFVLLGVGVLDIISNIVLYIKRVQKRSYRRCSVLKVFKEQLIDFYIKSDPYFFRLEQIFAFFVFVLYIVFEFFNFIILITGKENPFYFYFAKYFVTIGRSFVTYAFAFFQAILPLIITILIEIYKYIKSKRKIVQKQEIDIDVFLKEDDLFDMFLEFAKDEWSQENVLAYRDIKKFKRLNSIDKRKHHAVKVYHNYFNGAQSPLEVNIDTKSCNDLRDLILQKQKFEDDEMFEDIERTVKINIRDTWSRFVMTSKFTNYQQNTFLQKQELDNL